MSRVAVVGIDGAELPARARDLLAAAALVVGGARQLAAAPAPAGAERVVLGPLDPAVRRLREHPGPAVVLASGDPGLFGVVRRLREEGLDLDVLPAVSSVTAAFARLGLPWDGAAVVSAHGRDLRRAVNAARALPLVAVLTAPGAGPAEIAAGLRGWPRRLAVFERLGWPDERLREMSPAEAAATTWSEPNLVVSVRDPGAAAPARTDNQPAAAPAAGWALPESAYEHRDSMITKSEVRALAVAELRPRLGRLVWDVGAGSGSVGIECAALGSAVVAVERDRDACATVAGNARSHGVDVRVVCGEAPAALDGLPAPDSAFIGGGGPDVLGAVAHRRPDRVVVALAALDRVAPALALLRDGGYHARGVQLSAARLADLPHGSVRLAATNPVVVLTAELA